MGYGRLPFSISPEAVSYVAEIVEGVSDLSLGAGMSSHPKLRRVNRLRSIHSSLAIEDNTLTLDQVTDVVDGRRVFGSPREILEVKDAFACYEMMPRLDPYDVADLLRAHGVMMEGLAEDSGRFRSGGVAVFAGEMPVHTATPADTVPGLIHDLMDWAGESDLHPLIKGCVFHYEFEVIHPFSDGNGRTGRFWHTLILSGWKEVFAWIPVEAAIGEHRSEYYDAIARSTAEGESTPFIDFMLRQIRDAVNKELSRRPGGVEDRVLELIREGRFVSGAEAAETLSVSERTVERAISDLKNRGLIERQGSRKTGRWIVTDRDARHASEQRPRSRGPFLRQVRAIRRAISCSEIRSRLFCLCIMILCLSKT